MAIRAYNSPGVTVAESTNAVLAPLLANPSVVALVGAAAGSQHASERLILNSTSTVELRYAGIDPETVVVRLASDGSIINGGNYKVVQNNDPDLTISGDETYTIERNPPPTTAPTLSAGTGSLTGTYTYAISFVNAGGETGIGPESNPITLVGQGTNLSAIAVGPSGTSARNVYRKKSIDTAYHLVATINGNTTTTSTNESTTDIDASDNQTPLKIIPSGDTVIIGYDYTNNFYFEPTNFDDFDDIVDKYGPPFDTNGNVNSPLTFAARLVFLNGASEIICTASESSSQSDIETALLKVEAEPEVRLIAVASGESQVNSSLIAHVDKMNAAGLYRQGVIGLDGSNTNVAASTLRSTAQGIADEAITLVSPASFAMQNPVTGRPLNVGGQYVAAAVIGMIAARDVQIPITRKNVAGFSKVNDKRTASELALDSASGLLVIEPLGVSLRIRQGISTAVNDINKREISVVRAKYNMAHRLKGGLDGLVGTVAPLARVPLLVASVVIGILEQLITEQSIDSYSNVKSRVLTNDPTTVEVRFQYTPAYPVNNINIIFQINTQTGEFVLG